MRQNYSGIKYGKGKNVTEKLNGWIAWKKNYMDFRKALTQKYEWILSEQHWKKYLIEKSQFTSIHDRHALELNTCLEETNIPE